MKERLSGESTISNISGNSGSSNSSSSSLAHLLLRQVHSNRTRLEEPLPALRLLSVRLTVNQDLEAHLWEGPSPAATATGAGAAEEQQRWGGKASNQEDLCGSCEI